MKKLTQAVKAAAVYNIEDCDPYLDAEAGAWLHLEDRRDVPPTKLYADGATQKKPVRIKLLGIFAESVQQASTSINKRADALRQQRYDAAKVAGAKDEEAKKASVLTADEIAQFDGELYAACVIDSENLGYKGQAKLTKESAQELLTKRFDIRKQVSDFVGKPQNFKRDTVVH